MSISWLVLELWQFSFIQNWPEIRKSEIPAPKFCPISGDWGQLGIPNLARLFLIKCYCFYRFWVIKRQPIGRSKVTPQPPLRLGLKKRLLHKYFPVKFAKFSPFLQNTSGRLLLIFRSTTEGLFLNLCYGECELAPLMLYLGQKRDNRFCYFRHTIRLKLEKS